MERRVGAPNLGRGALRAHRPVRLQHSLRFLAAAAAPASIALAAAAALSRPLPCRFVLQFLRARHDQRRVPERIPPVLGDDFLRQLDAGLAKRIRLIVGHPANTADDVVFRTEILAERRPLPAGLLDRQIPNHRLAGFDAIPRAQFGAVLAGPRDDEHVLIDGCRQPLRRLVLRQVAVQ